MTGGMSMLVVLPTCVQLTPSGERYAEKRLPLRVSLTQ
jgi:hypothetical protein